MDLIHIGFLVYPGVIQLDLTAAYQVLSFSPQVQLYLIGKTKDVVLSNEGLSFLPTHMISDCPLLDVICVPGGGMGQLDVMEDEKILQFLSNQENSAQYIISVCTGSLILAAAGLLNGYQATGHWAFQDQLKRLGATVVKERVVVDRNRITGAGVTSGLDLGLTLLSLLCGNDLAKSAQLMLEYNPAPPFNSGSPDCAEEHIVKGLLNFGEPLIHAFEVQTKRIANIKT